MKANLFCLGVIQYILRALISLALIAAMLAVAKVPFRDLELWRTSILGILFATFIWFEGRYGR